MYPTMGIVRRRSEPFMPSSIRHPIPDREQEEADADGPRRERDHAPPPPVRIETTIRNRRIPTTTAVVLTTTATPHTIASKGTNTARGAAASVAPAIVAHAAVASGGTSGTACSNQPKPFSTKMPIWVINQFMHAPPSLASSHQEQPAASDHKPKSHRPRAPHPTTVSWHRSQRCHRNKTTASRRDRTQR